MSKLIESHQDHMSLPTITMYWDDGAIEIWLADEDGTPKHLIKTWQYPTGKSPVAKFVAKKEEKNTKPTSIGRA